MSSLQQFDINFVGLKTGKHEFVYQIDNAFFEAYEYSPVKEGRLDTKLTFDKKENFFSLHFEIDGTVVLTCDRCLGNFDYPVKVVEEQLVKISEEAATEEEEWVVLNKNDYQLNVAPFIYEFILLALPLINLHPELEDGTSTCDPETLRILKNLSGELPAEGNDPRWDALKNINPN